MEISDLAEEAERRREKREDDDADAEKKELLARSLKSYIPPHSLFTRLYFQNSN